MMTLEHIASRQNQRVKQAAKLRSQRQRRLQGQFLIDGARELSRAAAAGIEIIEAYFGAEDGVQPAAELCVQLQQAGAFCATVAPQAFVKLSYGDRQTGVVGVAQTPQRCIADWQLPSNPLLVVTEGLEKPGNVGAVLRSADGAGADGVVVADPATDLFNPNTIRASLGTVFADRICTETAPKTLDWLADAGVPIFAARPDAKQLYTNCDFAGPAAIVLGSEADGLSAVWRDPRVTAFRLPMHGVADSLNVSAAATAILYEARRQRSLTRPT